MPYIVVSVLEGMSIEKKKLLAKDIAQVVSQNFGPPPEIVAREIVFDEISLENYAPAVEFTTNNPPAPIRYISIHVIEGRSLEQKKNVTRGITEVVAKNLNLPYDSEDIVVEITETSPNNVAHGGVLTRDKNLSWDPK